MTLRTTPEQDAAIEALAKRWGVSKTEAILRAVEEARVGVAADDETARADEVRALSAEMKERWGPVLDRLGSV